MATYKWSIPSGKEITGSTYLKDTDNYIGDTIDDLVDFVNGEGIHENQGITYDFVDKVNDQTITGVKTFTQDILGNIKFTIPRKINGFNFDGTADINTFTTGMIMLWSGSIVNIPTGWYLCNGANGTPNLVDRFVVGAGSTYAVGTTGGSANAVVVSHTHTASTDTQGLHSHSGWTSTNGEHTHGLKSRVIYPSGGNNRAVDPVSGTEIVSSTEASGSHNHSLTTDAQGSHAHNITVNANGEDGTNKNLPPYYALCYIMKG